MQTDYRADFDDELDDSEVQEQQAGEMFEHFRFVADTGQSLLRIDKFLVNRIEHASRTKIQEAADAGQILVNGAPIKANYKVKPRDVITIVMAHPRRELEIIPENIPLNIVFEDDHLMVINKQPGLVVHPGHGNYTGTLVNGLAYHLKDHPLFHGNDPRPGLVHRIDKDTSGLIVIAKTENAKLVLARQFFEKTTARTYQAIVWGSPEPAAGTIVGNIARSLKDRLQMAVFDDPEIGKHAVTHYRTLENLGYVSVVECKLETGRTHQIRVHMKHIGHPLFNDSRYGGNQILKGTTFAKYKQFIHNCFETLPRQALHAKTLGFVHPATGEFMSFDSELPTDISLAIEKWRHYIAGRNIEE
jgi:23S rRNA pseudouridine1911/1915/1917 synthase